MSVETKLRSIRRRLAWKSAMYEDREWIRRIPKIQFEKNWKSYLKLTRHYHSNDENPICRDCGRRILHLDNDRNILILIRIANQLVSGCVYCWYTRYFKLEPEVVIPT